MNNNNNFWNDINRMSPQNDNNMKDDQNAENEEICPEDEKELMREIAALGGNPRLTKIEIK